MIIFEKGELILDPTEEMGYEVMNDLVEGSFLTPENLRPFGGAPEPVLGGLVVWWLNNKIKERCDIDGKTY